MRNANYDHDVYALMTAAENLQPNTMISYNDMLAAINAAPVAPVVADAPATVLVPIARCERGSYRWRQAVAGWQASEFTGRNRVYRSVPSLGYMLLHSDARIDLSERMYALAQKRITKAQEILDRTDPETLSDEHRARRQELARRLTAA